MPARSDAMAEHDDAVVRDDERAEPPGVTYLEADIGGGASLPEKHLDAVTCHHGLADVGGLHAARWLADHPGFRGRARLPGAPAVPWFLAARCRRTG
jgi:hypothetical protein